MPADERIRITFTRVEVRNDGDWIGSGEWYFIASVGGAPVGDRTRIFNARENAAPIDLPNAQWRHTINVRNLAQVEVRFQVMDQDVISDDDMGTVRRILRRPYRQQNFTTATRNFILHWHVHLSVAGGFAMHPPNAVFAARRNTGGGVTYSTVSGVRRRSRMEVCPIIPCPPDANMPTRPAMPLGTTVVRNSAALNITTASDINILPNPSVIPLLSPPAPAGPGPGPALAAGAQPRVTVQTAARIEFTYYWPHTLNFTDNDPRLEWEITPAANAAFIGGNLGRKVMVYGRREGGVLLRMRFQGAIFAEYRAVVKAVQQIPFRANILNGPNAASQPRATPQDVQNHIAVANRFLRQVGLELTPDTNTTRRNSARATGLDGIFRIRVGASRTRNVHGNFPRASRLNCRANVLNIQYIRSLQAPVGFVIFGRATDLAANAHGGSVSDNQTPTPSWHRPSGNGCGVPPDPAPGGAVAMTLLPKIQRANPANLFAFLITNDNGDPSTAAGHMTYGNVIVHELGHVLTLRHRNGAGPDGLGHPLQQNIMCQGEPATIRQDLDRLQAEAMHGSPLVP